jgi:antitoxin component YwqK of YwqJK toxin-antitoxin module
MKIIIAILVIFSFVSECNADVRVLEQMMSKRKVKHNSATSTSIVPIVKIKSPALKHKKEKQKSTAENRALKGVKHKEMVTSEDLDVRNDIAYLPNRGDPFTGKHEEYHSYSGKEQQSGNSQNGSSTTGSKDKKYIEIVYKDGKRNGSVTMWDENGIKIGAIYYRNGILDE